MAELNNTTVIDSVGLISNAHIPVYTSVSCCFALSVIYVSSLYVWNSKHNRDHPVTIKQRFCSVFVIMLIAPIFVYAFSARELLEKVKFTDLLGLRLEGLLQATIIPYLLTVLLFLGPLCVQLQNETLRMLFDMHFWKSSLQSVIWLRNHVVAPLSEEFVFRACMMPLILQSFAPMTAVIITPLFFGTGHLHHIIERVRLGMELKSAVLIACFQFAYTTIFGIYSAYLFARTGHFVAPFLVHAFANHMGLPDLQELWQNDIVRRIIFIICYITGFIAWLFLLPIATDPILYKNNIFWYV